MNKVYFKVGHILLELYNDQTLNAEQKYEIFENLQNLCNVAVDGIITNTSQNDFKDKLLHHLHQIRDTTI